MIKFPFSFYKVRFSDCDPFGHLNNARYIDYFLNAREDHLKADYDIELTSYYVKGYTWVVSNHKINYLHPVKYDDTVCIQTALLETGADYLKLEMLMMDTGMRVIKASLSTTFVCINPTTGRKQNHSDAFLEFARSIEVKDIDLVDNEEPIAARLFLKY